MNLLENLNKSKNNRTVAAIVLAEMGCEKPSIKLLSETSMLIEAARDLQKSGNINAIKIIEDSITAKYETTDLSSKYTIPEPYVGNEKNVLVIPDTHAPYCHVDLLFKMRELQETFDLGKVIHIGDLADNYAWSQYDKDPEADSASFEYAKTMEVVQLIYKLFPNVNMVSGNHESRLNKKFRTAGLLPSMVKTLEEIYEMPDGWSVHNEYVYNDILYLHGGVGDAYKYALNRGMNVVSGHLHTKAGVMYHATNHQTVWGMQVGTIIDDSKYVFDYSRLNSKRSILSCGIIIDGQPLVYNFGTRNTIGN